MTKPEPRWLQDPVNARLVHSFKSARSRHGDWGRVQTHCGLDVPYVVVTLKVQEGCPKCFEERSKESE